MATPKMTSLLLLFVVGCSQDHADRLVPLSEVDIYSDANGTDRLGSSSSPLEVIDIIHIDKADYVVEVQYGTRRGYVKDGAFKLEQDKSQRNRSR